MTRAADGGGGAAPDSEPSSPDRVVGREEPAASGHGWQAVLFDLDGTLADTVDLILHCFRHTMTVHRGEPLPDEAWLRTIGTPLREQFKEFATSPEEVRAMIETYEKFQRTVHDEHVRAFDGSAAVVERLAEAGTLLAVVTSKRRQMAIRTLERCGYREHIQVLVGADDVERAKPDPQPVHLALEQLGRPDPARVVFLGDSPFDVRAGREAGVRTGAVLWGPHGREVLEAEKPDWVLSSMAELAELVLPPAGSASGRPPRG